MTRRLPLSEWKLKLPTCNCETCQSMCGVPCFPSPDEARKLIRLGYGPQLMLNSRWKYPEDKEVFLVCPAHKWAGGASDWGSTHQGCTLQKKGKCTIHNVCKPIEGRLAICEGREPVDLRDRVVAMWNNPSAQRLVKRWIQEFGKNKERLMMHFDSGDL